jgi:flagellar hook-basal body complex protein FliE
MKIQATGLQAYNEALSGFIRKEQDIRRAAQSPLNAGRVEKSFAETFESSLEKVNALQGEKTRAIESFASGETQNVHELMISLQKAGLAMSLTSAVRGKVLEAYRELSRMQF